MSEDGAKRPEAIEAIVLATTTSESKKSGKTRKVTFEIPADGPNPFEGMGGERIHLVVVRLNNDETPVSEPSFVQGIVGEDRHPAEVRRRQAHERKVFLDLRRTAQAALRCQEVVFRAYLNEEALPKRFPFGHSRVKDSDSAAYAVRSLCGVASRSEFDRDPEAAGRWDALEADYYAWAHGRR